MNLRARGRAANDFLSLLRVLDNPDEAKQHLASIVEAMDALVGREMGLNDREAAVASREAAAEAHAQAVKGQEDKQFQAAEDLGRRERQLVERTQDLEVAIRNHSADVAAHEDAKRQTEADFALQQADLDDRAAALARGQASHLARGDLLDQRETDLNARTQELDDRAKRIAEAIK